ncbi:unnamed protein product [Allacma fusca]|uniref:Uncharacterized protein n=1 Tax=Allacma fusca TaxID=39272 RepID=A0A8J2K3R5_9HEXA|nr:unnamed protein product [Allacma fusca]
MASATSATNPSVLDLVMDPSTPKPKDGIAKKKPYQNKWHQKRTTTKVRVKLPSIESYQKELEFPADAPGRVIVRLERLMGTDKIRITDAKYMSTLLERLEQEENEAWLKRTRERKQAERNRFRQLVVEGLTEPTPDMEDIYNHPVFRVNRILNRLAKLDTNITLTPTKKLPPITPVEPFADSGMGRIRYSYVPSFASGDDLGDEDMDETETKNEEEDSMIPEAGDDEGQQEEWGGEDYYGPDIKQRGESLAAAKAFYGIPPSENVESKCKAFRSKLVDLVFDDDMGGVAEMYQVATDVLGAYKREQMTADDFVIKLNKLL